MTVSDSSGPTQKPQQAKEEEEEDETSHRHKSRVMQGQAGRGFTMTHAVTELDDRPPPRRKRPASCCERFH